MQQSDCGIVPALYHHTHPGAPEFAAAGILAIPEIADDVPTMFATGTDRLKEFGRIMLDSGMQIRNNQNKSVDEIIGAELARLATGFFPAESRDVYLRILIDEEDRDIPDNGIEVQFCSEITDCSNIDMDAPIDAMHAFNPALAWYFWSVMEYASRRIPVLTPLTFLGLVEHTEWMGEADESFLVDGMLADGVPEDQIDVVRKADVLRVVLPWELRACMSKPHRVRRRVHVHTEYETRLLEKLDAILLACKQYDLWNRCTTMLAQGGYQQFVILCVFQRADAHLWMHVMDNLYRGQQENGIEAEHFVASLNMVMDARKMAGWKYQIRSIGTLWSRIIDAFAALDAEIRRM